GVHRPVDQDRRPGQRCPPFGLHGPGLRRPRRVLQYHLALWSERNRRADRTGVRMKSLSSAQDNDMDIGTFWEAQFNVTDMTEITADSFLNWVRDSYVGMIGQVDLSAGGLGSNRERAAMFWNGGTVGTTTSPGWRGTN